MNDIVISNIISKTYFIIVNFFIFIFLLLCTLFIILQHGLFIDEATFSNIKIKQLYIKWDEKINISLKELDIYKRSSHDTSFNPKQINNYLKEVPHIKKFFNSITIEKIVSNNIQVSFNYKDKGDGFIYASSKSIELNASIHMETNNINIEVQGFKEKEKNISAKGNIYFDTQNITVFSNINVDIANEANLTLYAQTDINKTKYSIESNKKIKEFSKIIHLVHLPKEIMFWAYEAINMKQLDIHSIKGFFEYDKLTEAYKNLSIKADVNKLAYTYNTKLDAIHTTETELEFKNGVLYIRPKQAYSYGMFLGESWLKIDFAKPQELLTLHLLFDGIVNKDMLKILHTYKIKLPFLQNSGKVKTDLTLAVNLRTIGVDAKGTFFTKKANFNYLGLDIDIYNALIKLDNYDVSIKNMQTRYKNIASADIDVAYDAKQGKGIVDFRFNNIHIQNLHYASRNKPLLASYHIDTKSDFITLDKSQLKYKNKTISFDALNLPIDLQKLDINIPTTFMEIQDIGDGYLSGNINLKKMIVNLDLDVLKFSYDGVQLNQTSSLLKIKYDKEFMITSLNDIYLNASGSIYKLSHMLITTQDNKIHLKHTNIEIGKYITTKVYAQFDTQTKKSHISLNDFILKDPNTDKTLYANNKILLSAHIDDEKIKISSKELDGVFYSQESGWRLKLNSIGRLHSKSPFLKRFHITNGDFTLYKNKNDKYTRIQASTNYPYKILVKNNTPLASYNIKGNIYKEKVYLDINDAVDVEIKNDIKVNLHNSVVNIFELKRLIADMQSSNDKSKILNISVKGKNASIYLTKERRVLYDNLKIQFFNAILTAQLRHKNGSAGLQYIDQKFQLYGKDFDDLFMENLFALSKFENGSVDFSVNGDIDDYSGVIYMSNTTIKDYKILNNILAFINTVPSLVTFSLPGYSSNGLNVKYAYLNFTSKKNLFHLSDIYLDSKEIDILGKGDVDMNQNSLDIILNLKTDLGSGLSKVPLVGYIIFDGDSISTTLSITGKTDNPTVKSLLAQEIVVAPLNIIKRTLTLPYKLVKDTLDQLNP